MTEETDRVEALLSSTFEDSTPNIEASNPVILIDISDSIHFRDKEAYKELLVYEETIIIEKMRQLRKIGEDLKTMLYTHRGIFKTISHSRNLVEDERFEDEQIAHQLHEVSFELLKPLIEQARSITKYRDEATEYFKEFVLQIIGPNELVLTTSLIDEASAFLDSYVLVDLLLGNKPSFSMDFANYKRELTYLSRGDPEIMAQLQEMHMISLFIATRNSMTSHLKTEIGEVKGGNIVLESIVKRAVERIETTEFLFPKEKYRLLRVISSGLVLLDQQDERNNVFKNKNLSLTKIGKIIKQTPVFLFCGDMAMEIEVYLEQQCPHFTEKTFITMNETALQSVYILTEHVQEQREAHNEYVSKFSHMMNSIRIQKRNEEELSRSDRKKMVKTLIEGLQLLSSWTMKVIEQAAYKYTHPAKPEGEAIEASGYELVVKYNFSKDELTTLVEFIAMIKGVGSLMQKNVGDLVEIVRAQVHDEIQEFVQIGLRSIIKRASKSRKKRKLRDDLILLRTIYADWADGKVPEDPAIRGKQYKEEFSYETKMVGLTDTQYLLMRSFFENLFIGKVKKGKFLKKKLINQSEIKEIQEFVLLTWIHPYLVDLSSTIRACTDLGDLWYREYHLDLNEAVQFPIEMSLPWLLTQHALSLHTSHVAEMMLFPLSLYNDASQMALSVYKRKYLYDEIEAEVNLCFDQLVFEFSEQVYLHYKYWASTLQLDKVYRAEMKPLMKEFAQLRPPKSRYQILLQQRHFQLLGRTVNLNALIAQRLNNIFRENIDLAIMIFESQDATAIIEFEELLNVIETTHELLSKNLTLDPFNSMLLEMNKNTSMISLQGRVVLHCIYEFINDIIPNGVYNSVTQRFTRAPVSFVDEPPRSSKPTTQPIFMYGTDIITESFAQTGRLTRNFFGMPHILSMLRLIGTDNLPLIAQECLTNVELKIQNVLAAYVEELQNGIYTKTNLPSMDLYKTDGCFGQFEVSLKPLREYAVLESEVYQNFRELGNTIVLMYLFEQAMPQIRVKSYISSSLYLGAIPESIKKKKEISKLSTVVGKLVNVIDEYGIGKSPQLSSQMKENAEMAENMYTPPKTPISIFKAVLLHVNKMLNPVRENWLGSSDRGLPNIERSNEFYRLWSALQFMFCLMPELPKPDPNDEWEYENDLLTNVDVFGDGVNWAGATIIHFLHQREMFDALDFTYHIINAYEALEEEPESIERKFFYSHATRMKELNDSIFSFLRSYAPLDEKLIIEYDPPTNEELEELNKSQTISFM